MGYVKNDDGTPLGYTVGIVQTQGSSLREQPWALRRNSVGVEDIDNKDQGQISSYQVLRTGENVGVEISPHHILRLSQAPKTDLLTLTVFC